MKFEDLLPIGKKLHELTDEEIDDIIEKCSREDLEKIESKVRRKSRTTKSKKSLESERKKKEEFDKILMEGLNKGSK